MAELADALDSGSSRGNSVEVQVFLAAFFYEMSQLQSSSSCKLALVHSHNKVFAVSADVKAP